MLSASIPFKSLASYRHKMTPASSGRFPEARAIFMFWQGFYSGIPQLALPPRFLYLLFPREFLIDRNIISFTSPILASLKKSFTTSFRGICKLDYTCMVTRSLFFTAVMFTDNFFKPKAQVFPPIEPQSCLKTKSHLSKSVVTRSRYNFT